MPCTDWTRAGLGAGRDRKNLAIFLEAIDQVAAHLGNVWVDGSELCTHDDPADCDEDVCYDHMIEPSGVPVTELCALVDGMTADTAGLMLAPVIWILGLRTIGAPIETIVIERSAALPLDVQDYIQTELTTAGCEWVNWSTLNAAACYRFCRCRRPSGARVPTSRPTCLVTDSPPMTGDLLLHNHQTVAWLPDNLPGPAAVPQISSLDASSSVRLLRVVQPADLRRGDDRAAGHRT